MAKQAGLGDNLYVAGYDLSGDVGSLGNIAGGPAALDVTAIDKSAMERIGGVRDGRIEFSAFFNDAAGRAHPRLSSLPTANVIVTYYRGTTLGNPAAALVAKQINYDGNRGDDGSLTFAVEALGNGYGLEWGQSLTAGKRTDTGATNGTGVDFGTGSTNFGLQAYLQVFAFTGTDVTIKLQESSDNGADAYADVTGGGFTQVTSGPTSERIATANNLTVERFLRAVTVTTGGFSSLTFAVVAVRNDTAVAF
jgi:hypothetical protein